MSLTQKLGLTLSAVGLTTLLSCAPYKEKYEGEIPKYHVTIRIDKDSNGEYMGKGILIQADDPAIEPYFIAAADFNNRDGVIDHIILNNKKFVTECGVTAFYSSCTPEQEKIAMDFIKAAEKAVPTPDFTK